MPSRICFARRTEACLWGELSGGIRSVWKARDRAHPRLSKHTSRIAQLMTLNLFIGSYCCFRLPERSLATPENVEVEDVPERHYAVPRADLFSFLVSSAVVTDRNLVYRRAPLGDFCRDLDFDAEAVRLKHHGSDDVALDGFVSGLHVGHVQ